MIISIFFSQTLFIETDVIKSATSIFSKIQNFSSLYCDNLIQIYQ